MHLPGPSQEYFHPHQQFLDTKGFSNIVVGAALEPFDLVFLHGTGGKEQDGHHIALLADLFGNGKTVFVGHHDIQQTDAKFILVELVDGGLPIGAQDYVVAGVNQVVFDDLSQ